MAHRVSRGQRAVTDSKALTHGVRRPNGGRCKKRSRARGRLTPSIVLPARARGWVVGCPPAAVGDPVLPHAAGCVGRGLGGAGGAVEDRTTSAGEIVSTSGSSAA